jgi:hypothetical protein
MFCAALIVVLAGCGSDASLQSGTPRSTITPTAAPTTPITPTTVHIADPSHPASVDSDGLHIQTASGVQCEPWITLTDPQRHLDVGALNQITAYLSQNVVTVPNSTNTGTISFLPFNYDLINSDAPPLPATYGTVLDVPSSLHMAYGSTGTDFHVRYSDDNPNFPASVGCQETLQITNLTNHDIELDQLGVRFLAASAPDDATYPLVDLCSVNGCPCPTCGGSGAYGCTFAAQIDLHGGAAGTQIDVPLRPTTTIPGCVKALVPAKQVFRVVLEFSSREPSQRYVLGMTLTARTAQGEKTITVPAAFDSDLTFAAPDQFTCYRLVGDRFVAEIPPDLANCI